MSIKELVITAHNNAVSKGWWVEERSFGELIALIHSEVSEALEDYRNKKKPAEMWYEQMVGGSIVRIRPPSTGSAWKPCGIPSELADVVIRVFDVCGKRKWGELLEKKYIAMRAEPPGPNQVRQSSSFPENLSILHNWISDANRCLTEEMTVSYLALVIIDTFRLAKFYSIDLENAIAEKMAYNATRSQRHGGKVI